MRLSFDFPANTKVLAKIGDIAAEAGKEAGFNDDEIGDIQLAVDEACTNTITHGLQRDASRTFQLVIQWDPGQIEILIHETGAPFNPLNVRIPNTGASLEERPVGGLGFFFIRNLMDLVEYRMDDDGLKTLRLVKKKKNTAMLSEANS